MARRKGKYRKRERKPKVIKPDDVLEFAGITIARHGRFIHMQSHRTPEQQTAIDAHMASNYPKVVAEIDGHVARIRELIAFYDPLELMKRGYWVSLASRIGKEADEDFQIDDIVSARMLDYVQSVIVSTSPTDKPKELTDEAYDELCQEVKMLYMTLYMNLHLTSSAHKKTTDPNYDPNYDFFSIQAQMHYIFVRSLRYPIHDFEFFRDFLGPHDKIFRRLFGISVFDFIDAIKQIHVSLSRNSIAAFEEMHEEYERFQKIVTEKRIEETTEEDLASILTEFQKQPGWQERRDSIGGRIGGLDLFDLQKITSLPVDLLDHLSFSLGEDERFFAKGDYPGWPLRVLPIKFRPFLKVDSNYYCFDHVNIMDDIYRTIQRLICRLEPAYVNEWNDRQKDASEKRPLELLQKILPGATIYQPVVYPCKTGARSKANWCELDGLVVFDDILFIIEVKAGAFTWTPPSIDFPAYLDSIKILLKKPADQAARFLEYFRNQDKVPIYDKDHNRVAELGRQHFRIVIPLCVTLDALTAAYQISELQAVGIQVQEPVCCFSIDDLRIYRDIFDSPVLFSYFMQKRYEAEHNEAVHVDDELDHLGLYLAYIDYVQYAKDLKDVLQSDVKGWRGYRSSIDKYYFYLRTELAEAEKPQPAIGPRLSEILYCLDREALPGRCRCAALLLGMTPSTKKDFEHSLLQSLDRSCKRGQLSPIHIQGDSSITVFCEGQGIAEMNDKNKRAYALAWMHRAKIPERLLLSIRFDSDSVVRSVRWEYLRSSDLSPENRPQIEALSTKQARRRVSNYLREHGKIGRNALCPCGSGRKYKRCCDKK